jgi:hypothetical protein
MIQPGFCFRAQDRADNFLGGGEQQRILVAITTGPLAGSLTITGLVDNAGAPVVWTINAGSAAGLYQAPGSGKTGGGLAGYTYANAADQGKAVISCLPA